jgi:hypothetical protein
MTAFPRRCGSASARHSICATARIRTRRPRCTPTARQRRSERQTAPGQGAELQQHCRSASGMGPGAGVRGARLRDHQAHQSLWNGSGKTLAEAYKRALECDPVSAFGGVIGVNRRSIARRRQKWRSCSSRHRRAGFDDAAREILRQEESAAGGNCSHGAEVGAEECLRRRVAAR